MTARLPTPGSDAGDWGSILNGFLEVSLNSDGTLSSSALTQAGGVTTINGQTATNGSITLTASELNAVPSSSIGIASGIASLNSSTQVPSSQLGSGTASSSNFLRGDGTWAVPSGAANATTASVGLVQLDGDLGGTATSPTVTGIQGNEIATGTPSNGQVLSYSTTTSKWTASTPVSAPVASVFGRTGAVVATTGDYTAAQVTNALVSTNNLSDVSNVTQARSNLGAAEGLTPTAVMTAAYTANPGDFVPVDVSAGSVTITLPTAPADKTRIEVKMINTTGSNTVSVNSGGSDVFNKAGGAATETLTLLNQAVMLQYTSATALWYVQSDDLALVQLDGRYLPSTGYTSATYLKPSGDTTGATDTANISGLCSAGAPEIVLGAGTFYIGAAGVTLATGNWLHGAGTGATIITIASGFTGTAVFNFPSGGYSRISDLSIVGESSTITANPACNGIEGGTGRFCRVDNVFFQYINGWCGEDVDSGSSAAYASIWSNISALNCAGGIHLKGVSGANWGQQQFMSNINMQQIGVGSGTNANLDVFRFEDSWDIVAMNFNAAVSDASTGSTINIIGKCASLYFTNMDLGCYPNSASMTNACIQIQDGTNGSPSDIRFVQGEAQQGLNGLLISGGGATVHFNEFRFFNNYGSGVNLSGTGSEINFLSCTFSSNGQGGSVTSGTYYDLQVTNSATGEARFCRYTSPVVSVGTNGVQMPVALPTAGYTFYHHFCIFAGSGTPATPFTHVPGLFTRADAVPPQWNGRMNVTSGQSSNSGFQSQNSASAPSVPFSQFIAKTAGDQTAGVFVSGDSIPRLLVDSNGKHSWGPGGSSAVDTDLYRASAGVLQTDNNLTVSGTATGQVLTASGLTGATAASRYAGATASGAPTSGTFSTGDYVIDQTGKIWVCSAAGTPGTWTGVGNSGNVASVTAADTSIVVGGSASSPTIKTATLDVIATDHPPAASWSNNSLKITNLENGSASTDAAAFGQIPVVDATASDIQPIGVATAGSSGKWADAKHVHPTHDLGLLYLEPSGATGVTVPRYAATTVAPAIASGTAYAMAMSLPLGIAVNNITFFVNSTVAASITNGWYALLDSGGVVRAVSASSTSSWGSASSAATLSVSASGYTTTYGGVYYVVVMIAATTMPTFTGATSLAAGMNTAGVTLCGTAGTGLSTPPSTGSTMTVSPSGSWHMYAFTS